MNLIEKQIPECFFSQSGWTDIRLFISDDEEWSVLLFKDHGQQKITISNLVGSITKEAAKVIADTLLPDYSNDRLIAVKGIKSMDGVGYVNIVFRFESCEEMAFSE